MPQLLRARVGDTVCWSILVLDDPLPAQTGRGATDLIDDARQRMLQEGWDLAVVLTDLPLRVGRRPVVADASATHGVAVLSLPALGPIGLRQRAGDMILRLVEALVGEALAPGEPTPSRDDASRARRRRVGRRLAELASSARQVEADDDGIDVRFVAAVVRGNLRLLAGMVRANHPWRLIPRLSRALAAAGAAVVFALVTSDIWRVADELTWPRLTALTLLSIGSIVSFLVVAHGLWEHPAAARDREQAVLFNLATTITLTLGVLCLYVALLALAFTGAALTVDPDVMREALGHRVDLATYGKLAWLASSLATVAGALGAGLESDAAVREAAYGYHPELAAEAEQPSADERRSQPSR